MSNNQLICPNCNGTLNHNEIRQGFLVCPYCRSMNVRAPEQAQPTTHSSFTQQPQNPIPQPQQQPQPQIINSYQQPYAHQSSRSGGGKTWLWVGISVAILAVFCIICCVGAILIADWEYNVHHNNPSWTEPQHRDQHLSLYERAVIGDIEVRFEGFIPSGHIDENGLRRVTLFIQVFNRGRNTHHMFQRNWEFSANGIVLEQPDSFEEILNVDIEPGHYVFLTFDLYAPNRRQDIEVVYTPTESPYSFLLTHNISEIDEPEYYSPLQPPPANSPVIGSWHWNGSLFYVFYANGAGQMLNLTTMEFVAIRWYQDEDTIHICTTPNDCEFGRCWLPASWNFAIVGDTMMLENVDVGEIYVYFRPNVQLQTPPTNSLLIGNWYYNGELDIIFNANGGGIFALSGGIFRWYVNGNVVFICITPDDCLVGRCPGPWVYYFVVTDNMLVLTDHLGGTFTFDRLSAG